MIRRRYLQPIKHRGGLIEDTLLIRRVIGRVERLGLDREAIVLWNSADRIRRGIEGGYSFCKSCKTTYSGFGAYNKRTGAHILALVSIEYIERVVPRHRLIVGILRNPLAVQYRAGPFTGSNIIETTIRAVDVEIAVNHKYATVLANNHQTAQSVGLIRNVIVAVTDIRYLFVEIDRHIFLAQRYGLGTGETSPRRARLLDH